MKVRLTIDFDLGDKYNEKDFNFLEDRLPKYYFCDPHSNLAEMAMVNGIPKKDETIEDVACCESSQKHYLEMVQIADTATCKFEQIKEKKMDAQEALNILRRIIHKVDYDHSDILFYNAKEAVEILTKEINKPKYKPVDNIIISTPTTKWKIP
ncbi:MAG: hypothetical protein AABY32_01190 [Nanoarchaeota archaeon]